MYEVYMKWSTAEAREKLSQLVRAVHDEPQLITNRGRPVAVVIDPTEYEAFQRWREHRREQTLSEALDMLRSACATENYALETAPRSDRANPFAD